MHKSKVMSLKLVSESVFSNTSHASDRRFSNRTSNHSASTRWSMSQRLSYFKPATLPEPLARLHNETSVTKIKLEYLQLFPDFRRIFSQRHCVSYTLYSAFGHLSTIACKKILRNTENGFRNPHLQLVSLLCVDPSFSSAIHGL